MRLSIFGVGYVGAVSAACLARDGHNVIAVDVNAEKVENLNRGVAPVIENGLKDVIEAVVAQHLLRATTNVSDAVKHSEVCLICVGTPSTPTGELDTTQVERCASQIGEALRQCADRKVIAVRSTILPGTTDSIVRPILEAASGKRAGIDFDLVMHPEFLREGVALDDYVRPAKTVIGEHTPGSGQKVADLYAAVNAPLIRVPLAAAEMIKYVDNVWHALKVGFANEIGSLCKQLELDSHVVMDAFCADTKLNISTAYLRPGYAFGGSCLPKDVRALNARLRQVGLDAPIIGSINPSNLAHMQRGLELVLSKGLRKVGVLGLAFKAGTDDLRESPIVELIERLIGKGCKIKIYDESVHLSSLIGSNKEQLLRRLPHIAELMTDEPDELIESSELLIVGNGDPKHKDILIRKRPDQTVIDLVRIRSDINCAGYTGICW